MIIIRYTFVENEFVATLYLDDEPIDTRTFSHRDQLNRWARSEGCGNIEKEPSSTA